MKTLQEDTKKVFRKLGTCSRTFFYLLNREFGHNMEIEERAADPLAGGIMKEGRQCGMLWGAALAVGAEAYRRRQGGSQATALAIRAVQSLIESFSNNRTNTVNCRDITETDFNNKLEMWRYLLFRTRRCFNLAEEWAPEAVQAAEEGLKRGRNDLPEQAMSCASETAKKMSATEEETAMVAGFAGGLGLSGNACGALSAAMWINTLGWSREHPGKFAFTNPSAKKTLEAFRKATDGEFLCPKICGRRFETLEEHTEFVKNGGCKKLMEALAGS